MWSYLKTVQKPIVLYGMGNGADKVLAQLRRLQIPVQGVFASDGFVRGHQFHGFDVLSYAQAVERFGDMVVLLCFGSQRPEVLDLFRQLDLQQELYAPDMPVAGEGLFDTAYYHAHQAELEFVRSRLADAQSRLVFDCVVQYKLSGKIAPLFACQTPMEEAYESILKLCNHERFLDLGAYTGDTIAQFLQHVQSYDALYAVEPDPKNFAKLQKRTSRLSNCHLYPVGIHSAPGHLPFCVRAGRLTAGQRRDADRSGKRRSPAGRTACHLSEAGCGRSGVGGAEGGGRNHRPVSPQALGLLLSPHRGSVRSAHAGAGALPRLQALSAAPSLCSGVGHQLLLCPHIAVSCPLHHKTRVP